MKRREFIKRTAATGSLITGTRLAGLIHPDFTKVYGSTTDENMSIVGIAGSNDPELSHPAPIDALLSTDQVREVVWLALDRDISPRSLNKIVERDSWVVIKPNLVTCPVQPSDWLAEGIEHFWLVTDLRVVKATIEYLIERISPQRITIAEGPPWYSSGGKLKKEKFVDGWHCKWKQFGDLSYAEVVDELNNRRSETTVDIVDLNEDEPVYVTDFDPHKTGTGAFQDVAPKDPDGSSDTEWTKRRGIFLPRTVLDCDVLITIPVMKTHSSAGVTLCMKNFVGAVHSQHYGDGNGKVKIHQGSQLGLVRGIADLACAINPDYAVVEGFWATVQQHLGQNGVGINHNVVIAGGDVVAAEAVSMIVMGYHPLDSDLLRMCHMKKLGQWYPDAIKIVGPSVKSLRRNFTRAVETYFARGVRKWLMLGSVKSSIKNVSELNPRPGDRTAGVEWKFIDGDAIIDACVNISRPFKLHECLLYGLPGSKDARKGSFFYLALRINTSSKDLVGQLLVGVKGGDLRAFFNGHEKMYNKEPLVYDPTPTPYLKFMEGENILVLEVKKLNSDNEEVKLAANICDLDGDRLEDITFDPKGE